MSQLPGGNEKRETLLKVTMNTRRAAAFAINFSAVKI